MCASRYGLGWLWDWYALVTRPPGVVVGSLGGGGQGGCDGGTKDKESRGTEARMQVQRHSRVYDFLGSSERAKWDNG